MIIKGYETKLGSAEYGEVASVIGDMGMIELFAEQGIWAQRLQIIESRLREVNTAYDGVGRIAYGGRDVYGVEVAGATDALRDALWTRMRELEGEQSSAKLRLALIDMRAGQLAEEVAATA